MKIVKNENTKKMKILKIQNIGKNIENSQYWKKYRKLKKIMKNKNTKKKKILKNKSTKK